MPRPAQVKMPLDALLVATGSHRAVTHTNDGRVVDAPITSLAHRIGVRPRTVQRWRVEGIPLHTADQVAIRCGMHPTEVWDGWWAACFEQERLELAKAEARADAYLAKLDAKRRGSRVWRERQELVRQYQQVERARERVAVA